MPLLLVAARTDDPFDSSLPTSVQDPVAGHVTSYPPYPLAEYEPSGLIGVLHEPFGALVVTKVLSGGALLFSKVTTAMQFPEGSQAMVGKARILPGTSSSVVSKGLEATSWAKEPALMETEKLRTQAYMFPSLPVDQPPMAHAPELEHPTDEAMALLPPLVST